MARALRTSVEYLQYARQTSLNPASTVFQGTLYEFHVLEELSGLLRASLERFGGAYDNGKDIGGTFDVAPFVVDPHPQAQRVRSKLVKPTALRKSQKMDLVVQCKCFSTKISAKEIRELRGILEYNVRPVDKFRTLGVLCSPSMLTTQAMKQMDQSDVPLGFAQIPRLRGNGGDPYDPEGYVASAVQGLYLNPVTLALWQGTSLVSLSGKLQA